jgi:hypothetical protein
MNACRGLKWTNRRCHVSRNGGKYIATAIL